MTVLALDVVEHHPRPDILMEEVKQGVKDDGVVIPDRAGLPMDVESARVALSALPPLHKSMFVGSEFNQQRGCRYRALLTFHSWLLLGTFSVRRFRGLFGKDEGADDFIPLHPPQPCVLGLLTRAERRIVRKDRSALRSSRVGRRLRPEPGRSAPDATDASPLRWPVFECGPL